MTTYVEVHVNVLQMQRALYGMDNVMDPGKSQVREVMLSLEAL
jgi:hypothetical protein